MAIILSVKNVSCEFGDKTVLSSVNFDVCEKDRVGIIGDNGCGKTTLLNIIAGITDDLYTTADIQKKPNITMGFLSQTAGASTSTETVEESFLAVFEDIISLENKIRTLEADLTAADTDEAEKISDTLTGLYTKYEAMGGLTYLSRMNGMLKGMGFDETSQKLQIKDLSGGQKTRLSLGKLLLKATDLLLLDEPTNHLDIASVEFLEETLKGYPGTLLIVSHDRHFLETVTTKTLIVESGIGTLYPGSYEKFKVLREQDMEYRRRCYAQQQKEIKHINEVIETQRMWNREKNIVTAESWQKKLDRMEILADPDKITETNAAIDFEISERGGNDVLSVKNLGYSFPDKALFSGVEFELHKGDRLAIVGANGGGKSTLVKILTGNLEPVFGSYKIGANITVSYYSQDFSGLNTENTLFDEIFEAANYEYYHENGGLPKFHNTLSIRNALASFGFYGDNVFRQIKDLSGGEKARLVMLKLTYKKANLLILDEPTNHLDIRTCEILEDALLRYPGTLIFVSHDRYFTNKLATMRLNMDLYSEKAKEQIQKPVESSSKEAYLKDKENKAALRKLTKIVENLEKEVSDLEAKIMELDGILASPDNASDFAKIQAAFDEKSKCEALLEEKEFAYLEALENLENFGK